MTENKNILEVHHLKKNFTTGKKSFTAVEDISFSLKTGEVLGIVGESGSGKSTVAKMITHLTEPTAGEIFFMEKRRFSFVDRTRSFKYAGRGVVRLVSRDAFQCL